MQNSEVLVGNCIQTLRQKYKIKRSEYLSSGAIPVVDQSREFVAGYINDGERTYDGHLPVIVFGDHTCTLKYVDFPFAIGAEGTQLIRPTKDFDIRYFYYSLRNLPLEHFGYQRHFKYLKTSKVFCPPMQEQRKIAAILGAYDDLIENNTRRIEILEEMAGAIYREWFVEFRFPGHEGVEMVESELGLIPQGWEVKQLGEVTSVITKGTTPTTLGKQFTSEGINFIKVQSIDEQGDILDDKLTTIDNETHELLKRSQLQENDILFSIAGAIGRVATVPKRFLPANTNQALAIIRPSDLSFTTYLYRTLRSLKFLNYSLERVVQTAQANVSLSVLSSAPIIMPMKVVLEHFNKHLTPITNLVNILREKNANLRQIRDLLLPKLISGELDVSELNINTD